MHRSLFPFVSFPALSSGEWGRIAVPSNSWGCRDAVTGGFRRSPREVDAQDRDERWWWESGGLGEVWEGAWKNSQIVSAKEILLMTSNGITSYTSVIPAEGVAQRSDIVQLIPQLQVGSTLC